MYLEVSGTVAGTLPPLSMIKIWVLFFGSQFPKTIINFTGIQIKGIEHTPDVHFALSIAKLLSTQI